MFSFKNLKKPINIGSGIADTILLAPASFFNSIKIPEAPFNTPGAEVSIFNDHVFKSGKGFIEISLAPFANELTAKNINDVPAVTLEQQISIFIPGSYPTLHEMLKNLLNIPLVVLARDSNCEADLYYQFGGCDTYAYLSGDFSTGTTRSGKKGYTVTITWINSFIQLYYGLISKYIDSAPGNSPVFLSNSLSVAGDIDQLEALYNTAATTNITQIYQAIVANADAGIINIAFANDNDEQLSEYLVPVDLSSQANFVASLYDWLAANGNGQYLQMSGTELRFVDPDSDTAFFGIAIPQNIWGWYDEDNNPVVVAADDDHIVITQ